VAPAGIPSPLTVGRPAGGGQGRSRKRFDGDDGGALSDRQAADSQPDPMKTAFGYIGADSFTRQRQGQRGGQRAGGSSPGGGRGNGGAPGGGRRGGRGR
jgi:23S rRNA pseudouridine2605 synthase